MRPAALQSNGGMTHRNAVSVRVEERVIPTYMPAPPDKNPMFLEKRVYQGSSGRVYPLPFTDRIEEKPVDRVWKAVWIENEFLRAMVLPELGGRIHILQDKTNGYDLIYNQPVIKPALVGLAGPWISGGIEFNWPQHHRPATFLPVDFEVEECGDGSKIVWCSDHDPMCRMKGMHGVCLHPGRAYLELKARVSNRTPFVQTFLWWANVATRVHEAYRSFFPPDVHCVADHARRSMSEYPLCQGLYYGVNYGQRARSGVPKAEVPSQFVPPHCQPGSAAPSYAPNDLSFYANIPVPTSYMCIGSKEDFFGGYDFREQAGIVHVANHHISPGKKQWTWGNHDFGYAWDRNLTDADANGEFRPYIEIMAGVYTDNQPDFSFLQPGETKTWSQYWYPIRKIGPPQHANLECAVSTELDGASLRLGVAVTRRQLRANIEISARGKSCAKIQRDLSPSHPFVESVVLPKRVGLPDLTIKVTDASGKLLLGWQPKPRPAAGTPAPATEPPAPQEIKSADELYIIGLHLEQYRHATRSPVFYWSEALRRDPLDARCNNALGLWHLRRGEFAAAEKLFLAAIARLTARNANPYDGEAYYNLGLCRRFLHRDDEAYDPFYKAAWNQAWAGASYHALAEIDCCRADWPAALDHLNRALRLNADNMRARNLKVLVLRKLHSGDDLAFLRETLALDPMDWWARHLSGEPLACDLQGCIDIALDYARAGFLAGAISILRGAAGTPKAARDLPTQSLGALPMIHYALGWVLKQKGDLREALCAFKNAAALPVDYCFPSRLEEIEILETAMRANPLDSHAPYFLGNLLYDKRRHEDAIPLWERAARRTGMSVVWRNLGLAYFNVRHDAAKARAAYDRAFRANPNDARLLYERDQLWKRLAETPAKRLRELERHFEMVRRDDLTVEVCALYNQTGRHTEALELLASRQFQPWEGGEGGPLAQHVRAELALGRAAMGKRDFASARAHFERALTARQNLGEAKHLLANQSDIHFWLGCALFELGQHEHARRQWEVSANFKGDFQEMRVRAFSEMTYYSALALERLGQRGEARALLRGLLDYARRLEKTPAKIDYFATSLPAMLLFDDDLDARQKTTALFLQAQARLGLGEKSKGKTLLRAVLRRDPNHPLAADLLAGQPK
jgi:tetratricopeptide (TPR) repeat protein